MRTPLTVEEAAAPEESAGTPLPRSRALTEIRARVTLMPPDTNVNEVQACFRPTRMQHVLPAVAM